MAINLKRGGLRLAIVVAAPWLAYWGDQFHTADKQYRYDLLVTSPNYQKPVYFAELSPEQNRELAVTMASEKQSAAEIAGDEIADVKARRDFAVTMLVGGPLGAVLSVLLLMWIAAGFRPKQVADGIEEPAA